MTITQIELLEEISKEAGFDSIRFEKFKANLEADLNLQKELFYYLDNNDFLCETKISGFSIVDILIWQIDHFRAFLDRDTTLTRNNPRTMALLAIETMLEMKTNPEKYLSQYSSETGTDQIIK